MKDIFGTSVREFLLLRRSPTWTCYWRWTKEFHHWEQQWFEERKRYKNETTK